MSGTPRKAHSVSQAAVNGFCRLVTKAESSEVEEVIRQIAAHLREHPQEARPTMLALESGLMGKKLEKAKTLCIPYTRCKIGDLSQKLLQHVILETQSVLTADIFKRLTKSNKDVTHRLFYALFAEMPQNPVFTHDVEEFTQAYISKHKQIDIDMSMIKISVADEVQWGLSGCYKMQVEGGKIVKICHYSGCEVAA